MKSRNKRILTKNIAREDKGEEEMFKHSLTQSWKKIKDQVNIYDK